jgi:hypothetical protein
MESPRQGSTTATRNVVPLDPASRSNSSVRLLKDAGLGAAVGADAQAHQRGNTQKTRRHLGHEGSEDLGRGVLTSPRHVFGHVQDNSRTLLLGSKGGRGAYNRGRGKGRRGGDNHGKKEKCKFGHFELILWKERGKDEDAKSDVCKGRC